MITITKATQHKIDTLVSLGRDTYVESHGHFIASKDDLEAYVNSAFSNTKLEQELKDPNQLFYIIYVNNKPAGYAKLVLASGHASVKTANNCQLERIYILKEFIPLKIGQQLLRFLEAEVKKLKLDAIWLTVYKENKRAIRFYEKHKYVAVGTSTFYVNNTGYDNVVFMKNILKT